MGRERGETRVATVVVSLSLVLVAAAIGCGDDDWSREEALERLQSIREEAAEDREPRRGADGQAGGVDANRSEPTPAVEGFGSVASGGGRARILAGFDAYMDALVGGDYEVACARLAQRIRNLLQRFGARRGRGGCKGILAGLPGEAKREARRTAEGKVAEVRVDNGEAKVILQGAGGDLYQMPMHHEGAGWRAGAVSAPIVP